MSSKRRRRRRLPIGDDASFGYSGGVGSTSAATSQDREERQNESAGKVQRMIYGLLAQSGTRGLTQKEIREFPGAPRDPSGNLTNMLKVDRISRIWEVRDGHYVYILEDNLDGREPHPYEPQKKNLPTQEGIDRARALARMLVRRKDTDRARSGDIEVAMALNYLASTAHTRDQKIAKQREARDRC